MTTTSNKQRPGSYAAGGDAPSKKKFPWWLLLLALLALGVLLWLLNRGGDDQQAADAGSAATTQDEQGSADGVNGSAGGAAAGSGQITAGDATVYPAANGANIGQFADRNAVGKNVTVESVVSDEGFWAGDANDRVFVHLRTGGDESGPQVRKGDRVDFEGTVKAHDKSFAGQRGVEANEGAEELTSQGAHIEVPEVAISDK